MYMKEISDNQFKAGIVALYKEAKEGADIKKIISKAAGLGMAYQESKIRKGIEIVFDELHNKENKNI